MGFNSKPITSYIRIKHYGYLNQNQINRRKKTYDKLSNDPMSIKTLPMSEKGLRLVKWREFDNNFYQYLFQRVELIKWNYVLLKESLSQFFNTHASQT